MPPQLSVSLQRGFALTYCFLTLLLLPVANAETIRFSQQSGNDGITLLGITADQEILLGITDSNLRGISTGGVRGISTGGVRGISTGGVRGISTGGVRGISTGGVRGISTGGVR